MTAPTRIFEDLLVPASTVYSEAQLRTMLNLAREKMDGQVTGYLQTGINRLTAMYRNSWMHRHLCMHVTYVA